MATAKAAAPTAATVTFNKPVKVDALPPAPSRGGKASLKPAMLAWLQSLPNDGTYELVSSDSDKGHPTNRVAQMRELAGAEYTIDTRTLETGKRYRIFATRKAEQTEQAS